MGPRLAEAGADAPRREHASGGRRFTRAQEDHAVGEAPRALLAMSVR